MKPSNQLSELRYINLNEINYQDQQLQTRQQDILLSKAKAEARESSDRNVKALAQELRIKVENEKQNYRKAHLEPLILFKPVESTKLIILSGFHRYMAYLWFNKKHAKPKQHKKVIPAHLFQGTLEEALLYSASLDIKPNVPKTMEQKLNAAWTAVHTRNTAAAKLTAQGMANHYGVSKSSIDRMRQALKKIDKEGLSTYDNWKVQTYALKNPNKERSENSMDEKIETMYRQILSKYLHDGLRGDPLAFKQLLIRLAKHADKRDGELDALLNDTEESDF